MKKILTAIAIVALMSSCKKDRVCKCKVTTQVHTVKNGQPFYYDKVTEETFTTYDNVSKHTAKENCISSTTKGDSVNVTNSCVLH